jgi:hypothetical protein
MKKFMLSNALAIVKTSARNPKISVPVAAVGGLSGYVVLQYVKHTLLLAGYGLIAVLILFAAYKVYKWWKK